MCSRPSAALQEPGQARSGIDSEAARHQARRQAATAQASAQLASAAVDAQPAQLVSLGQEKFIGVGPTEDGSGEEAAGKLPVAASGRGASAEAAGKAAAGGREGAGQLGSEAARHQARRAAVSGEGQQRWGCVPFCQTRVPVCCTGEQKQCC